MSSGGGGSPGGRFGPTFDQSSGPIGSSIGSNVGPIRSPLAAASKCLLSGGLVVSPAVGGRPDWQPGASSPRPQLLRPGR